MIDEKVIEYLDCPKCGYRITYLEWSLARFDYKCSRCGEKRISEFDSVYAEDDQIDEVDK